MFTIYTYVLNYLGSVVSYSCKTVATEFQHTASMTSIYYNSVSRIYIYLYRSSWILCFSTEKQFYVLNFGRNFDKQFLTGTIRSMTPDFCPEFNLNLTCKNVLLLLLLNKYCSNLLNVFLTFFKLYSHENIIFKYNIISMFRTIYTMQ